MKQMIKARVIWSVLVAFLISIAARPQTHQSKQKTQGWHQLDKEKDGYYGISLHQAYELLKGRESKPVIVAVVDSGIDTAQEDLKPNLWRNPQEVSGNGIDDDKNGYADDVYGWNFCGSKDGENLVRNSYEATRVYHAWKKEFEGKKESKIPADKKFLYGQWAKAKDIIENDYDKANKEQTMVVKVLEGAEQTSRILAMHLNKAEFKTADLKPLLKGENNRVSLAAEYWIGLLSRANDTSVTNVAVIREISDYKEGLDQKLLRKLQAPEDLRAQLIKDNYTDINDRYYGNNNLKTGSGNHGTMVAGTIAATRNNGIGTDGIADNVRIMAIRAMPGGDEHDKDVALAIRYAVDNGAQIINISLGKYVSPYKQFVDDAVRYAASKNVLIVHAAGNDARDITRYDAYPSSTYINGEKAGNFITVGASGDPSTGALAAPFSNYSRTAVDIFAPGVFIHSTATNNSYQDADGTSLAAPVVSGVAALLKSYFPRLTPAEIISIITSSGKPVDAETILPGTEKEKVDFSSLSSSGRIVNACEAVKLALLRYPSR
jgi:subtilisin family serine protease